MEVQPRGFLPLREGAACRGCKSPLSSREGPCTPQQHCLPGREVCLILGLRVRKHSSAETPASSYKLPFM